MEGLFHLLSLNDTPSLRTMPISFSFYLFSATAMNRLSPHIPLSHLFFFFFFITPYLYTYSHPYLPIIVFFPDSYSNACGKEPVKFSRLFSIHIPIPIFLIHSFYIYLPMMEMKSKQFVDDGMF